MYGPRSGVMGCPALATFLSVAGVFLYCPVVVLCMDLCILYVHSIVRSGQISSGRIRSIKPGQIKSDRIVSGEVIQSGRIIECMVLTFSLFLTENPNKRRF